MILKGSQRGSPQELAAHLLNIADNDHVTVEELRGFVADDLKGAMAEVIAVAKGTRCKQPIFSLSLSPPKEAVVSYDTLFDAADRAEAALGLRGQPRAVVVHEKEGRCHAHVVWSRIDADKMTAINLPFFKERLNGVSKELYLEHGWPLPDGYKALGMASPLNFTLAEWQQAKRQGIDPREMKQAFIDAWARSDGLASFKNALEDQGLFLAKGDRRGLVAFDLEQNVYAVARWANVKTKELKAKLGDTEKLPTLDEAKSQLRGRLRKHYLVQLSQMRERQKKALKPFETERKALVQKQRIERLSLIAKHKARTKAETLERSSRFRKGLATVLDLLTGRLFALRKQNAAEALAGVKRDRAERQELIGEQRDERRGLQTHLSYERHVQTQERLEAARLLNDALRATRIGPQPARDKSKDYGLELEM